MPPGLGDLGPNQVCVVQQPFRGRGHRMSQTSGFEQIPPGRVERKFRVA